MPRQYKESIYAQVFLVNTMTFFSVKCVWVCDGSDLLSEWLDGNMATPRSYY